MLFMATIGVLLTGLLGRPVAVYLMRLDMAAQSGKPDGKAAFGEVISEERGRASRGLANVDTKERHKVAAAVDAAGTDTVNMEP